MKASQLIFPVRTDSFQPRAGEILSHFSKSVKKQKNLSMMEFNMGARCLPFNFFLWLHQKRLKIS